nr:hypothetical protein CFP56_50914 [Quercus suber]
MGLLSYMRPRPKNQETTKTDDVSEKPLEAVSQTPQYPSTPGSYTPGNGTPWGSRPASLYPVGEFRNSQAEDLNEIKCDVMVNWLYQQQMERLWTAGGHDEGVVLKKSRSAYTCCPADIVEEPYGFHKAIETLNVRVCIASSGYLRA